MGDFGDFLGRVLWNWWTVLAGVMIAIEPVTRLLWPGYDAWAAKYLSPIRRRKLARIGALVAFIIANYLAFHDAMQQVRDLQAHNSSPAGRHLDADQKTRMRASLQLPPNVTYLIQFNSVLNCDECENYAQEFRDFFGSIPGWSTSGGVINFPDPSAPRDGLQLVLDQNAPDDLANRIRTAFSAANLPLIDRPREKIKDVGANVIIVVARQPK